MLQLRRNPENQTPLRAIQFPIHDKIHEPCFLFIAFFNMSCNLHYCIIHLFITMARQPCHQYQSSFCRLSRVRGQDYGELLCDGIQFVDVIARNVLLTFQWKMLTGGNYFVFTEIVAILSSLWFNDGGCQGQNGFADYNVKWSV